MFVGCLLYKRGLCGIAVEFGTTIPLNPSGQVDKVAIYDGLLLIKERVRERDSTLSVYRGAVISMVFESKEHKKK